MDPGPPLVCPQRAGTAWREMGASMRAVLAEVLVHGPLPRAQLARRLMLSPASLTKLTRPLLDQGLLVEDRARLQPGSGRPAQPLDVLAGYRQFIGIKPNWDDLFAVRTDLRAAVLTDFHMALPSREVADVVEVIAMAIDSLDPMSEVGEVGISLPGNVRAGDAVVRESAYLGWVNVPLAELVAKRTGRRVILSNDVQALTAAQHWFGAGTGSSCFALVVAGKGLGCGMVVNNQLVAGYDGRAGLASHLPIREGGPLCWRGHRGCASSYLTTGAISRALAALYPGSVTTFEDCLERARAGDAAALRVFQDACHALGVLVAHVVNLIGPERVVLSGEGIEMLDIAPDALQTGIEEHLHADASPFTTIVRPFAFTEWARGAAVAAIQATINLPYR